ncbi:hypothetical protein ACFRCI_07555 [Streptomyces sp. NPDC056638]|uniref:hypothetical protein n=1 Tax=Streptomyces sp. NPDC056638 TaxID=3345887 RepID=UPI0036C433F7
MNTFLNVLGIAALIALFLLPTLAGLARERRIDRELREAERERGYAPPETADAAPPGDAGGRPHPKNRGRVYN